MKSSIWGYLFLILGIVGLLLVNLFGNITINNEQDYYLLKEITESAMTDAIDENITKLGIGYDGVTYDTDPESMHCIDGSKTQIRIVKEKFVESFIRHFSEEVDRNKRYTISFDDIDECPPKVTVTITTEESLSFFAKIFGSREKKVNYETDTADVLNILDAILESKNSGRDE